MQNTFTCPFALSVGVSLTVANYLGDTCTKFNSAILRPDFRQKDIYYFLVQNWN
jgi:hypothetical protein